MKKIRIFAMIAALLFSFTLLLAGCRPKTEKKEEQAVVGQLLENGTTEYKILIADDAGYLVQTAAEELTGFFAEATGVTLQTVTSGDVSSGKYISLGETDALMGTDIDYDVSKLGTDGFRIVTKGDDLYLVGGSDYGTAYAVYALLEDLVGFDYFYVDCYSLDLGVTDLPLYNYNVTEIPDIAMRAAGTGAIIGDNMSLLRMRQRTYYSYFIPIGNNWVHNSYNYVENSPDLNVNKWLSSPTANAAAGQLCYTAHGDAEEYEKMQNACLATLIDGLKTYPDRDVVSLTVQDNTDFCACEACAAMAERYGGANSASVILFVNDLNAKVRAWFETEEGAPYKRDLRIVFFAYNATTDAPVRLNEKTGKYEAIEGISMDEGVECFYAPINANYIKSFYDSSNDGYLKITQSWAAISEKMFFWYYNVNYNDYLSPCYTFNGMQDNYRLAVESGADWFFDLGPHNEMGFATGWNNLKQYLSAKLAWDCNADFNQLIDNFFEGYFGPAAEEMRAYFDSLGVLATYNSNYNGYGGYRTLYDTYALEKYWPKRILQQWLDNCDAATEAIAALKETDPDSYERYYKHIAGERISALYLFVSCYSYNSAPDVIAAYKRQANADIKTCKLTRTNEYTSINGDFYSL